MTDHPALARAWADLYANVGLIRLAAECERHAVLWPAKKEALVEAPRSFNKGGNQGNPAGFLPPLHGDRSE